MPFPNCYLRLLSVCKDIKIAISPDDSWEYFNPLTGTEIKMFLCFFFKSNWGIKFTFWNYDFYKIDAVETFMNNSLVQQHYNQRPEQGVSHRQKSEIKHLKAFNNWVKAVLVSK